MGVKIGPDEDKELTPYAGRWVARVRGKIVAQGATADQAAESARQMRSKEAPEIVFVPDTQTFFENPIFELILDNSLPGQEIFLVGGAVRDFLLRRETHDLDFTVSEGGIRTARRISKALKGAYYPLDEEKDVGRVILTGADNTRNILDFSSYRNISLDADLAARDFSINALAYNLRTREFIDRLGGVSDLKSGVIRACAESTFQDDPVRILRAVRFATSLGYSIHNDTKKLMKGSVKLLSQPSPERIRDELFKILEGPKPASAIQALELLGGLTFVLPELLELKGIKQPSPHVLDVWSHTFKAVDHLGTILAVLAPHYYEENHQDLMSGFVSAKLGRYRSFLSDHLSSSLTLERSHRALLVYSTLFHDVGKPRKLNMEDGIIRFHGHDEVGSAIAVGRAIKLRLSNSEMDFVRTMVRDHMRMIFHINRYLQEGKIPTRRAVYRFFRDTGSVGVDLCLLALADVRATYENELTQQTWSAALDVVRLFLENWWEKRDETIAPPQLVNGDDLMKANNLKPGPFIGKILEAIKEAQAVGEISTKEEALRLADELLADKNTAGGVQ